MKIYFICRWGNIKEGPNGEDTNFLVIAETASEAAILADAYLADCPWHNGPNVHDYCGSVTELGTSFVDGEPTVIHGPWVAHAIMRCYDMKLPCWHRLEKDSPWELVKWEP